MKVTFDTQNKEEVQEVVKLLQLLGETTVNVGAKEPEIVTGTAVEDTKSPKPKPIPKATSTPKKASRASKSEVTLDELKTLAKEKAQNVGRDKVKATIGAFAAKLSEVDSKDYSELKTKLEGL